MKKERSKNKGFTLIELVVVLAIISIVFGIGAVISFDSYKRYAFNSERDALAALLYKARGESLHNIDGKNHGVEITDTAFVLFSGEFDPDSSENEVFERRGTVENKGVDEVVFEALSGSPFQSGSIILSEGEETSTIVIGTNGRIDW